jgi:hypothetical protein
MLPGKFGAIGFACRAPGTKYRSHRKSGANTRANIVLAAWGATTAIALTRSVKPRGHWIAGNKLTGSGFKPQALEGKININAD